MKISVVIPLYNKARFVSRALESIFAQTKQPLEVIVIDDGSSDDGVEVVERLFGDKVRLIKHPKNLGVSQARNSGILEASGEFIAFLDADDYWLPQFLETIESLYRSNPEGSVFFTAYQFYNGDELQPAKNAHLPSQPAEVKDYFLACCNADLPITSSSVCIKTEALKLVGMFPVGVKLGEDQVVWGRLACQMHLFYSPEYLVVYDLNASKSDSTQSTAPESIELSPHIYFFDALAKEKNTPQRFVSSIRYLLHLSVMSCVRKNLMKGHKQVAFSILKGNEYLIWDKYRLIAFTLLLLPTSLISRFFRYARTFR
ncbi:glycosyltransferase family 2 protein [Pseudoalteromonas sp. S16_S37]|uniref:glycosyltransferase family 2 protein n=1 Tax=Pseudoalteromonas sp. S16_S37 TaxID=2720228 RepID=UPI0016807235|nr:glycosyltransferase family 2 protein [Pseudoalteromonas sp. S16_S37]MBD1580964.1 glycosyltransferase family 2 protein [Pseudoalteromonas sp. S16_S37]